MSKPMQLRLPPDIQQGLDRIAEANGIAKVDVIRLCLAQALPIIERDGLTIRPTPQRMPRRKAA